MQARTCCRILSTTWSILPRCTSYTGTPAKVNALLCSHLRSHSQTHCNNQCCLGRKTPDVGQHCKSVFQKSNSRPEFRQAVRQTQQLALLHMVLAVIEVK